MPWVDLAGKKRADKPMLGNSGFERRQGDFYATEPWVTRALLERIKFRGMIWEPACGRGDMAEVLAEFGYVVMASDIAGDALGCKGALKADFLTRYHAGEEPLSIVTNPPYTVAEPFIRKALELTERCQGMVAMLMRNEYDCAAGRRYLFESKAFASKLVLTRRPRWLDANQQHSASPRHNFAWMIWDHRHSGSARIEWLRARGGNANTIVSASL